MERKRGFALLEPSFELTGSVEFIPNTKLLRRGGIHFKRNRLSQGVNLAPHRPPVSSGRGGILAGRTPNGLSELAMRKKILLSALTAVFLLWLFSGNNDGNSSTRPVKKITKTTALLLLNRIPVWTFYKSVKEYNVKGQLVSTSYYDGQVCDSKYVYSYTPFDSLQQTIWLTGEQLHGQRIDVNEYDRFHRLHQQLVYEITLDADTSLDEKTAYFYNQKSQPVQSVNRIFNRQDTSVTTSVFAYRYTPQGLVATKTYTFRVQYIPVRTTTTQYRYDAKGRLLAKLEEAGDSIYYLRNGKGQLIEERKRSYPMTLTDKYWYDARGNQIKAYLDIDEGRIYEYVYDPQNRLRKEYSPSSFLFLLKGCKTYAYEFY